MKENRSKNRAKLKPKKKRRLKWIVPGIRVRIISRKFKKGKFYEEKVLVNDILSRSSFEVLTKNGQLLEIPKEKYVETYIPSKKGSKILVVYGDYKGKMAIL